MKHRLYIISGKGGTGKTSVSVALCNLLRKNNKKVLYTAFDHEVDINLLQKLSVPYFDTTVEKSCEKYIGLKLKSATVARWIMKTPFFSALFSILPSLGSMILLGHYIKELENDPELVIVLDSPATGHAKSMIEATYNFKDIFRAGVLVQDIHRMHHFLHDENNVKCIICSLPTEMSLQEASELKNFMLEKNIENTSILLNNFLSTENVKMSFVSKKEQAEKNIIERFSNENQISMRVPKFFSHEKGSVVNEISKCLQEMG